MTLGQVVTVRWIGVVDLLYELNPEIPYNLSLTHSLFLEFYYKNIITKMYISKIISNIKTQLTEPIRLGRSMQYTIQYIEL